VNWGLFLGLESFLLPLSLVLRVALTSPASDQEGDRSLRLDRLTIFCLALAIMAGKLPATIFAISGDFAALGRVTEGFMISPLGLLQMAAVTVGVLAADLFSRTGRAGAAVGRTVGIVAICLALGLVAAR
jgi:hypothetical protein